MSNYISFEKDGKKSFGILEKDTIYDLGGLYKIDSLLEFLEKRKNYEEELKKIETIMKMETLLLDEVKQISAIEKPRRGVFCVGKNYLDHAKEIKDLGEEVPEFPVFFTKNMNRILGPEDTLDLSNSTTESCDYEGELAIIIKDECKNLKGSEVWDHIFGFSVANDFSARDLQIKHSQWMKGKSLDDFMSMGSVVAEISKEDVESLSIKTFVNGEIRQNSNTKNFIFGIERILEDLSKGMTLFPGDIVLTGTPSGVGAGFNPPKFLKKEDIVEIEIEKIGKLKNYVK